MKVEKEKHSSLFAYNPIHKEPEHCVNCFNVVADAKVTVGDRGTVNLDCTLVDKKMNKSKKKGPSA